MRKPGQNSQLPKANPWGTKGKESKTDTADLFERVTEEIEKEIGRELGGLTKDIKQSDNRGNKNIRELTEDTNKKAAEIK